MEKSRNFRLGKTFIRQRITGERNTMAGRNRIMEIFVAALFALSVMAACSSRAQQPDGPGTGGVLAPSPTATPSPSSSAAAPPASAADGRPAEKDAASASLEDDPADGTPPENAAPDDPRPSLNGIALGTSIHEAARRFGAPLDRYTLPDGSRIVEMNEYGGFTVGFADGKAVYVEVYSPEVPTGIHGLAVGGSAEDAVRAIGAVIDPFSNVLVAEVEGGILKVDLDPETRKVISVRLIGQD